MSDSTDKIYIRELQLETIVGIHDWEQEVRQALSLDLEMSADVRRAARFDDIEHTLDYKRVAKRIIQVVEGERFQLVESVAERVAQLVLEEFSVRRLRLRLGKPGALRGARDVGVLIEREAPAE